MSFALSAASFTLAPGVAPVAPAPSVTPKLAWQSAFTTWSRARTLGALIATAALLLALCAQITLLSGWHLGQRVDKLALTVGNSVVVAASGDTRFEFFGQPAVAVTVVNLETKQINGLALSFDQIPPNTTLTLGWLSTDDLKRPVNIVVPLPTSPTPVTHQVLLRGHPQWRGSATRIALALGAPAASPAVTMTAPRIVSATPIAATALAAASWSGDAPLAASSVAERVLPLALWLSLAGVAAMLLIRWVARGNVSQRAEAIVGATVVLLAAAAIALVFSPFARQLTLASWGWILASLAIITTAPALRTVGPIAESIAHWSERRKDITFAAATIVFALVAVLWGGLALAWIIPVVLILLGSQRFPRQTSRLIPLLFVAPALLVAAIAQRFIGAPINADAIVDPSADFATMLARAVVVPALVATLFAARQAWPSARGAVRRNAAAGLAAWIALLGLVAACAVPSVSRSAIVGVGALWIVLPVACCVALYAWPAFTSQASGEEVVVESLKTEADLSNVVRSLFDGAASSFDHALSEGNTSSALAPMKRMQEIAPASLITHTAKLRYALASKTLAAGAAPYALLNAQPAQSLSPTQRAALVQYAHLTGDYDSVVRLAPMLDATIDTTRKLAHAQLFSGNTLQSATESIATLSAHAERATFAREIAELHLLRDDWRAAQLALAESGIELESLAGVTYVNRLALRATDPAAYEKKINDTAMWHPDLGIAQAAVAELLQLRGNLAGARARLLLAIKLDGGLWPIAMRLADIERALNLRPGEGGNDAQR
ncbi:MAG: hypothetical protein EAZ37_17030 [Burkholderiales bacterium]|nr:MAG: hypothetical protein EAZ43_04045 [Betaproteobacteria bacterium]TAG24154.1 MAG: hypothetical protein EAZ37_17030 [Burkholderiales bacterium]